MAKEKTVELKTKAEKVSNEHLGELQKIVNAINGIQFNIGKIESQKHNMLHELAGAQDRVTLMQDTLMKEYGSYDVNLTDGTINWPTTPEDVQKSNNEK
tara:strand:- start:712 stop:1008 length:297 start_codon:yes stop_codon:yes gene_type:complete